MRNRCNIKIGGKDYTAFLSLPITWKSTMNEELDSANVLLSGMREGSPFVPFTETILNGKEYVIADDRVQEIQGIKRYNHDVGLIERTKMLERIVCGGKAFTNPLVRDYTDGQTLASSKYGTLDSLPEAGEGKFSLKKTSTKTIFAKEGTYASPTISKNTYDVKIAFPDIAKSGEDFVTEIYYNPVIEPFSSKANDFPPVETYTAREDTILKNSIDENGYYSIVQYYTRYIDNPAAQFLSQIFITGIVLVDKPVTRSPYKLEQVVNILLDTAEPMREGLDAPRFTLRYKNEKQKEIFQQQSPEFRFSNGRTLWECLRQIGEYTHTIPRIVGNYLEFDELGGTEYANMRAGKKISWQSSSSAGDYNAGLDTMATNLINIDDESEGSIVEPYSGGYLTLRATSETCRIMEGQATICTAYPVARIISAVWPGLIVDGVDLGAKNISPYIFEKSEYDLLSSYSGSYPYSKTYALYYTVDGKDIGGLWYKAKDSGVSYIDAFENYSIVNILSAVYGVKKADVRKSLNNYADIAIRLTYIPTVNARVRSFKTDFNGKFPAVLPYNQSANKLSSIAMGENLMGQLAMSATTSDTCMLVYKYEKELPKAGQLYDDNTYIGSVTARVFSEYVLCQLSLSTMYNELGEFVNINNQIRQFEIPAGEDRYISLDEFVVIGDNETEDVDTVTSKDLLNNIRDAFVPNQGQDVTVAAITTKKDGVTIANNVVCPVISLAIGTSLYYGFRFDDNFSAGKQSVYVSGASYRETKYINYGDQYYGEADTVGFILYKTYSNSSTLEQKINESQYLPETKSKDGFYGLKATTGDHPIILRKDSADACCFSFQVHLTTNSGLIIGTALARKCPAVRQTSSASRAKLYYYDHRIPNLIGTTETNDTGVDIEVGDRCIILSGEKPSNAIAWAIIKDGEFLIGKNTTDAAPSRIYFTRKRKII